MNSTFTVLAPNPHIAPAHLFASDMHATLIPHPTNPRYVSYKAHSPLGAQRIIDAWANGQLVLTDINPPKKLTAITQPFCAASSTVGVKGCKGSTPSAQAFKDGVCNWALKRIQSTKYDWKSASTYTYDDAISGPNNAIVAILDTGVSLISEFEDPTGVLMNNTRVSAASASVDGQDLNGHGTYVASMAAGLTFGVAKNAAIVDCSAPLGEVDAQLGEVDESIMITNLTKVLSDNPTKMVIANCSWGSTDEWPLNHPLAGGNYMMNIFPIMKKPYADLSATDQRLYNMYSSILNSNRALILQAAGNKREICAARRGYMFTDFATKSLKDIGDSKIVQTFLGGPAGLENIGAVLTALFLIQNPASSDVKKLPDYTSAFGFKFTPVLIKVSGNVKQTSFMFEQKAVNVINKSLPIVSIASGLKYSFLSADDKLYPDQGVMCYVQMLNDDGNAFWNPTWSDDVICVGVGDRAYLNEISGIEAVKGSGSDLHVLFLVKPTAVTKFVNSFTGNNVRGKPNQAFITSALRFGGSGLPKPICLQAWVPPLGCGSKCGLNFEDVTLWNDGTSALAKVSTYSFLEPETIYPFRSPAFITPDPKMFIVSATTIEDQLADWSGVAWGGLFAPGEDVRMALSKDIKTSGLPYFQFQPGWKKSWSGTDYVKQPGEWSDLKDGTSFACPCVSGVCAAYIAKTKITDIRELAAWLTLNFVALPGRTRDATIPLSSDKWALNVNAKESLFNTQIGDYDSRNTTHKKLGFGKIGSVFMAST